MAEITAASNAEAIVKGDRSLDTLCNELFIILARVLTSPPALLLASDVSSFLVVTGESFHFAPTIVWV